MSRLALTFMRATMALIAQMKSLQSTIATTPKTSGSLNRWTPNMNQLTISGDDLMEQWEATLRRSNDVGKLNLAGLGDFLRSLRDAG